MHQFLQCQEVYRVSEVLGICKYVCVCVYVCVWTKGVSLYFHGFLAVVLEWWIIANTSVSSEAYLTLCMPSAA